MLLKNNVRQIPVPQKDALLKGVVLSVDNNKAIIDLGPTGIGLLIGPEFKGAIDVLGKFKKGDEISGQVLVIENKEGYIELSVKNAAFQTTWKELENKFIANEPMIVEVAEANKGGLLVKFRGISGFMPVSQLAGNHYPKVEGGDKGKIVQELKKLIKISLNVKIIDLNQKEKKIIFSEKAAEEKMQDLSKKYKKGDIVDGVVSGIVNFGIFVQMEKGVEGLVHISELAWQLIENPGDIIKVGDNVKAKIITLDNNKISLSLKALQQDPWIDIDKKYKKGDEVKGVITKLNSFGMFVALDKEIHGLCHISEFGTQKKMEETLEIGKEYNFKILSIDASSHRMALGLVKENVLEDVKEAADKKEKKDDKKDIAEKDNVSEKEKPDETKSEK